MYSEIRMVNPALLVSHPKNLEIYGDTIDADLERSILEVGILQAIIADESSMTILSGNSRCRIALKHGHEAVPVLFVDCEPDDEQIRMLIELNAQREKTTAQKAREYKELVAVKERQAKARQQAAGGDKVSEASKKTPPNSREKDEKALRAQDPEALPSSEKGRAKSEAAAEVGMGRHTAEKAADVVDEIDAANAAGDAEYAATLEHKLNNESVAAAHREVEKHKSETGKPKNKRKMAKDPKATDSKTPAEEPGKPPTKWIGGLIRDLGKIQKQVEQLEASEELPPGTEHFRQYTSEFLTKLKNAKSVVQACRPHSKCTYCKGKGCKHCFNSGWLTQRKADIAPIQS